MTRNYVFYFDLPKSNRTLRLGEEEETKFFFYYYYFAQKSIVNGLG